MKAAMKRMKADEGMSTAEYAIGTVAAAGFAGLLLKIFSLPAVNEALTTLIRSALTLGS